MSDEQPSVPTLRLKARVRSSETAADESVGPLPDPLLPPAAPPAEPTAASSSEPLKIRLKPRLNDGPASTSISNQPAVVMASSVAEPPVVVATPPVVAAIDAGTPERHVEPTPAPAPPRIRLQARLTPSENATPPAAPPAAVVLPAPALVPVVSADVIPAPAADVRPPVIAAPAASPAEPAVDSNKFKLKPSLPSAPAAAAPPTMIGGLRVTSQPPSAPVVGSVESPPDLEFRARPNRKPLFAGLVVVALAAGAYYGSDYFSEAATTAAPKLVTPATQLASTISHSETLNKLATMPGEMIQKAKDSIAARRDQEQTRVDASADAENPASVPNPVTPPAPVPVVMSVAVPAVAPTGTRSVAPGLTATMQIEAATEASTAFKEFVTNARISGIAATRVIINDRLVRAGEMAESSLGIRFDGYNRDTKQLRFSDRSGAHVLRRY